MTNKLTIGSLIDTMFIFQFVDPDLGVEILFEMELVTE